MKQAIDKISLEAQRTRSALEAQYQANRLDTIKSIQDLWLRHDPSQDTLTGKGLVESEKVLIERLSKLKLQETSLGVEQALLDSLYCPQMQERSRRITDTHSNTFGWIFEGSSAKPRAFDDFDSWLRTGDDIYWISGKPGSGKSTLMKFIVQDSRTEALLSQWSRPLKHVTASFYFWSSGTPFQRSLLGLLQSLFYEILRCDSSLLPILFSWRWRIHERHEASPEWTAQEFIDALDILKTQIGSPLKFCFFIDGLDEYEGDHEWITRLFLELAKLPQFKFCISSRPWNLFQDLFEDCPMLRLQDLTHNDIKYYTKSTLESHPRFAKLCKFEPQRAPELIEKITTKSAGVFLWVFLVAKSLLDGLGNGDSITDLQNRVDWLPADLKEYFMHILGGVDDFYFKQATEYFHVALATDQHLFLHTYSFLQEEDADLMLHASRDEPFSIEEIASRCEETQRRLNSRCKGLLEVYECQTRNEALSDSLNSDSLGVYRQVSFLHRSVRDFLEIPTVAAQFVARDSPERCWSRVILQAIVGQIGGLRHTGDARVEDGALCELIIQGFLALQDFESSGIVLESSLIDDFDQRVRSQRVRLQDASPHNSKQDQFRSWSTAFWSTEKESYSFLALAIASGLLSYVKEKLESGDCEANFNASSQPLLLHAIRSIHFPGMIMKPNVDMVRLVLRHWPHRTRRVWIPNAIPRDIEDLLYHCGIETEVIPPETQIRAPLGYIEVDTENAAQIKRPHPFAYTEEICLPKRKKLR